MDHKEFYDTVRLMRAKQKEYFKTRSIKTLQECKRLEKLIDDEIVRVDKIMLDRLQPTLFPLREHQK